MADNKPKADVEMKAEEDTKQTEEKKEVLNPFQGKTEGSLSSTEEESDSDWEGLQG